MEKGTSIVSTEEYMELLKFKKAMENEFVIFTFGCGYKKMYAYSKDTFLDKYEEGLNNINKLRESQNEKFYKISDELHQAKLMLIDAETKLENNIKKFGWESFIRGAIFGLGISALIFSIIYSIIK
jgi:hypothetical protein